MARCAGCGRYVNKDHVCEDQEIIGTKVDSKLRKTNFVEFDDKGKEAIATMRANRIVTLEELLEAAEVDMAQWIVDRHTINKWEMGAKDEYGNIVVEPLFQVKAWLKPVHLFGFVIDEIIAAKEMMESSRPVFVGVERKSSKKGTMIELDIPDPHFGMYAWGEETGGADWDLGEAARDYQDAAITLIHRCGENAPAKYLYVVGNDGIHADGPIIGSNAGGATTRGTAQDMDTRLHKVFRVKRDCVIATAMKLAAVAPVEIVVVSGNHDYYTAFYLGEVELAEFTDPDCRPKNAKRSEQPYTVTLVSSRLPTSLYVVQELVGEIGERGVDPLRAGGLPFCVLDTYLPELAAGDIVILGQIYSRRP